MPQARPSPSPLGFTHLHALQEALRHRELVEVVGELEAHGDGDGVLPVRAPDARRRLVRVRQARQLAADPLHGVEERSLRGGCWAEGWRGGDERVRRGAVQEGCGTEGQVLRTVAAAWGSEHNAAC